MHSFSQQKKAAGVSRVVSSFSPLQIREMENLSHLTHLRVLNLAGNEIACASGLAGLTALAELNFRRNRITHVVNSSTRGY